ncbi:MAG TPA: hypothetical protein VEU94_10435 [Terriglobales bacterium]|nr:hypothetical protein [Terriglobales bacterium]
MTLIACVTAAAVMSRNARRAEVGLHARHPRARTTPRPLENKSTPTSGTDPDLWLYRERTMGMLRRYLRLSVEVGRLPSLLGREFFRTRVTSYHAGTFEDAVIFVHDVARGLDKLGDFEHKLIAKIVLQSYTHNETARLLGCWRRTVGRRFPEAIDQLTDIFLEAGLLIRLPATDVARAKRCQENKGQENSGSDSEHSE